MKDVVDTPQATPAAPVPEPAPFAPQSFLEYATAYVNGLTDSAGVAEIQVVDDTTMAHSGLFTWDAIKIKGCVSDSILAHEVGHYLHALSNDYSWGAMSADSMEFCPGFDESTGRCEGLAL